MDITNASQAVVARYDYDAFGNTIRTGLVASDPAVSDATDLLQQNDNPYRFSTKRLHLQSGLYDYGFRFYSPSLGRWINRDPIGEEGGLNLYAFVYNSPTNYVDPDGSNGLSLSVPGAGGVLAGLGPAISQAAEALLAFTAPAWAVPAAVGAAGAGGTYLAYNYAGPSLAEHLYPNEMELPGWPTLSCATDSSKNEPHTNQKAKDVAGEALDAAREALDLLNKTARKTPEIKDEIAKAERLVKRLRERFERTGENHSRRGK